MPAARSRRGSWITSSAGPQPRIGLVLRLQAARVQLAQPQRQGTAALQPEEIKKLTRFLRTKFQLANIEVRKRPQKTTRPKSISATSSSACIFRDDEDGELSYNFYMAILDFDLE